MLKSLKTIVEKVKEFSNLVPTVPMDQVIKPIDGVKGEVGPGDIVFFRYKTISRRKTIDSYFICLASKAQGFGRSFKVSPKGNVLFCGFEISLASPETVIATLSAIYKNRQTYAVKLTDQGAKRMLGSILGIKRFKTFNILYMSDEKKLDMNYLIQAYNANQELEEAL